MDSAYVAVFAIASADFAIFWLILRPFHRAARDDGDRVSLALALILEAIIVAATSPILIYLIGELRTAA